MMTAVTFARIAPAPADLLHVQPTAQNGYAQKNPHVTKVTKPLAVQRAGIVHTLVIKVAAAAVTLTVIVHRLIPIVNTVHLMTHIVSTATMNGTQAAMIVTHVTLRACSIIGDTAKWNR